MPSLSGKKKKREEWRLVQQELEENPYRKFNIAFALMTIIPFLVFFYLLVTRLFTLDILVGDIGLIMFISIVISLCGLFVGYGIIRELFRKVVFYAAQAKRSDELKSTFVATASHEMKNPLFVISGNLQLVTDGVLGQVNERQRSKIEFCLDVIKRMRTLVDNLLVHYKIEAGMVALEKKMCDIAEIAERQINELEVMRSEKNITINKEFAGESITALVDEDKVTRVINNLVSNAIKYTDEEGTITVSVCPTDGYVKIDVQSTGESIPEEKLAKIFDKFERLNQIKEGTGLGLAITKDIVELHDGHIWAEYREGRGNAFTVVLPRE